MADNSKTLRKEEIHCFNHNIAAVNSNTYTLKYLTLHTYAKEVY